MRTIAPALGVRRAESAFDFEQVRLMRNAGREWMADSAEVTPDAQAAFRATFMHPIWLYSTRHTDIVGYGLIKPGRDRYPYVSLAVAPEYRNQGIGTFIYADLRKRWTYSTEPDTELWAVIRNDNTPSLRAALAAGYMLTSRIVGIDTVCLKATTLP